MLPGQFVTVDGVLAQIVDMRSTHLTGPSSTVTPATEIVYVDEAGNRGKYLTHNAPAYFRAPAMPDVRLLAPCTDCAAGYGQPCDGGCATGTTLRSVTE